MHAFHSLSARACRRAAALSMALAAFAYAGVAAAAQWPSRPVRIIIPAGPGGSSDPLARLLAEDLGKRLNASFVVENKPGANGNVGASIAAKAAPDGDTLLFSWTGTLVSAVTLYHSKPFDPQKDFEPIVLVGSIPNVIGVNAQLPIKDFNALRDYAQQHPNTLNFGSTGSGSSWHLSGEMFKKRFGVAMVHVPYTAPSGVFSDLIGNRLQVVFPGSTAMAPLVQDGRVRALAVMDDARSSVLPGVPTTAELGYPELASATWMGLLAPKGTPPEIVRKVNEAVNQALATPAFRAKLVDMGYKPLGGSPQEFATYMAAEIKKWGEVVAFSGAKID